MLPELQERYHLPKEKMSLTSEYSSGNDLLSLEDTRALLHKHGLLIGQKPNFEDTEMLA